jgi:hypothetical protein
MQLRILRTLYDQIGQDLARQHEFAFERVGFVSAKLGNRHSDEPVVLFRNHYPVADADYIDDPFAGARINSDAIRQPMQVVLDTGIGLFHVHCHAHQGRPRFSSMDLDETPRVVASLRVANPDEAHGMLLLSKDECVAHVWMPESDEPVRENRITIVGYPLRITV